METYTESFPIQFAPITDEKATVLGPKVRFSVLTSRLLRLEYSPSARFEDRPSQAFWYRQQPVPPFNVRRRESKVEIETEYLLLQYKPSSRGFAPDSLTILLKESGECWQYGQRDPLNLRGTARTLDNIDGAVGLEEGLISRSGWALWDDSDQLLFTPDGWLAPRDGEEGYQDLYFFGYGNDYYGCLRDFDKIAGPAPIIPRWALGNWWSRYWAYSAGELLDLMDEFKSRRVPLSVCIVDMDWHIVDTGNASSGWTGYTWNRELFPDPPAFIEALHERGLKTALNLHPAEGIHAHEDQYRRMAEALGVDPQSEAPIPFSIDDPQFTRAYFEELHHPYEAQGIDFWWLDWQQGTVSGLPGLDPLWWLNHLHFYDLARNDDRRPFIFSRWGGLGNHRYPIGFSGDALVTWESLAFQPYFTATAANVNYGWWSHDIGGHMSGIEDHELYTRWVQFGVFSPILRLHSTNNPYHERRPWGYDAETERVSSAALRLRHRLIPYLQSMSWKNHKESIPLVRPMYYEYPQDEQAYHCRDQYLFGSELVAAPFTTPADPDTRLSRQAVWLPPGEWFEYFSGDHIPGDSWHAIYGDQKDIPVFAKAGAMVPLASEISGAADQSTRGIELHIFPGDAASLELFAGEGPESGSLTTISQRSDGQQWIVEIDPAHTLGDSAPAAQSYELVFRGVHSDVEITINLDDQDVGISFEFDANSKSVKLAPIVLDPHNKLTVSLRTERDSFKAADDRLTRIGEKMLQAFRMNTNIKLHLKGKLPRILEQPSRLASYQLILTESQMRALAEHATSAGVHQFDVYDGQSEEIVVWNNRSTDEVQWVFAAQEATGLAYQENGSLPRFGLLTITDKGLTYHSGSQPAQGRISVARWFDLLAGRIPRDQIQDVELVIQFDISGELGCQRYLHLEKGDVRLDEGDHPHPDVTVMAADDAWLGLINGDLPAEELFLSGNLKIGGNFKLIAGLVDVFAFSPPRVYFGDNWRLGVNYLNILTLKFGKG